MKITQAAFITSSERLGQCPETELPEFAFIGRSNVGKSSLINYLLNRKGLAKTSTKPGKTRLINHFFVNEAWFLVDLPGYGYASASKTSRQDWKVMTEKYLLERKNLSCTFALVDARLPPQSSDMEFINWLGTHQIPMAVVMTKMDKVRKSLHLSTIKKYEAALLKSWEYLPAIFQSSATTNIGREDILNFIDECIHQYQK